MTRNCTVYANKNMFMTVLSSVHFKYKQMKLLNLKVVFKAARAEKLFIMQTVNIRLVVRIFLEHIHIER